MEKSDWYESQQNLINLLKAKKKELQKNKNDIAEIEYSIECDSKKVGDYKPEPKKDKATEKLVG